MSTRNSLLRASLTLGAAVFAAQLNPVLAFQQVSFSVDWQGPLVGLPDSSYAFPISEGDILLAWGGAPAFGPLPNPGNKINAGMFPGPAGLGLALQIPCFGHLGGTPCSVEVDAISYGKEPLTGPGSPLKYKLAFSVDRQSLGMNAISIPPNVATEALCGDAASDVFLDVDLGVGPLAPYMANLVGNTGVVDGNGLISCTGGLYKGVGLAEPASPFQFSGLPNLGDNLDALASLGPPSSFPASGVYFSLDANFLDPMTGVFNSGSALAHGFNASDVLWSASPGSGPVLFAAGWQLGLDLAGGFDDLDALILHENGTGSYEPSLIPNDWMGGATDMLLFSVRRGSPVIGQLDSFYGLPISEGDILTTAFAGSPSQFPAIYIAAENLGLFARIAGAISDDVDALDILSAPINDCNGNGVEDAIDIAMATSSDVNFNGIPDDCELLTHAFCHCSAPGPAPCLNFYAPGGCVNSTGVGAIMAASGTTSVTNDNLVLTTTQMPPNRVGLMFSSQSAGAPIPFRDGILCLRPQIFRFNTKNTGAGGSWSYGPGLVNWTINNLPVPGWILMGQTWNFQSFFRDPTGPCGQKANLSNAIQALFTL